MENTKFCPVKLLPACKAAIWGGHRLKAEYGKHSELPSIAETWELSCHPQGESTVASGPFQGSTLSEYLRKLGPEAVGTRVKGAEFPILVKFIDAAERLSVQVHPDDAYARRVEGQAGKNEMWYILDCEPGAQLLFGLKESCTREELEKAIRENTLVEQMRAVPVQKGDVYFIPAGTLHAIGKGILVAEIQQSSDVTYRVYDYGRLGQDGKPRQLHVEKALAVADTVSRPVESSPEGPRQEIQGGFMTRMKTSSWFTVDKLELSGNFESACGPESFQAFLCLKGCGDLSGGGEYLSLQKGDTVFLPSCMGAYRLTGEGEFLRIFL